MACDAGAAAAAVCVASQAVMIPGCQGRKSADALDSDSACGIAPPNRYQSNWATIRDPSAAMAAATVTSTAGAVVAAADD